MARWWAAQAILMPASYKKLAASYKKEARCQICSGNRPLSSPQADKHKNKNETTTKAKTQARWQWHRTENAPACRLARLGLLLM